MADTKITALTEDTAPGGDSLLVTVDAPGTTPVNRKVTITNLTKNLPFSTALPALAAPAQDDMIVMSDGTTPKTATVSGLLTNAPFSTVLPDLPAPAGDDLVVMSDGATPKTASVTNLTKNLPFSAALPSLAAPAADDLLIMSDGATPKTATVSGLLTNAPYSDVLPTMTDPAGADFALILDGTTPKKVTLTNLLTVKQVEFVPISYAIDGASAPAALETISSTNKINVRKFDDGADEDLFIPWQVPACITGSTIQFRVGCMVTEATGPSAEGVAFALQGLTIGSGDALGDAMGSAVVSTAAGLTMAQYDLFYTGWSTPVTLASGLNAGEMGMLKLFRDVSDSADDYAQDVGVFGIEIKYTNALSYT